MSGDILDLIDNAIEAHERWPDAMRWTPTPPQDDVDPETGLRTGGVIRGRYLHVMDETHCWTEDMVRRAEQLMSHALGAELTEWQREVLRAAPQRPFRRLFLNRPAASEEER